MKHNSRRVGVIASDLPHTLTSIIRMMCDLYPERWLALMKHNSRRVGSVASS